MIREEKPAAPDGTALPSDTQTDTAEGRERKEEPLFVRLDNPLPEPVAGVRAEMEFPITDTGDGQWPPLSEDTDLEHFDDEREDDFDLQIPEADDFDL